jgi:hypothetical protein
MTANLRQTFAAAAYKLLYAGGQSTVPLRGFAGQLLTIQGTGKKEFEWLPEDTRAMDLELRAKMTARAPTVGAQSAVIVRCSALLSHGANVWNSPSQVTKGSFAAVGQPDFQPWILPARGMVWRFSAREFRITFEVVGMLNPLAPIPVNTTITVSMQPTQASDRIVFPIQQFYRRFENANPAFRFGTFPMEANTFRVFVPATGRPFAAAVATVGILDEGQNVIASVDAINYAALTPIPPFASYFVVSAAGGPPFAIDAGLEFQP